MIKYSIIIPHFNRPDIIMNTINSFKKLKNKEIIIVDDVSTAENLEKLKNNINNIRKKENIILYSSKEKLYLSKARNIGLELSKGEWIYFIDDDDEARTKFIKFLNKNKLNTKINVYRFPNIEKINGKFKGMILKYFPWNNKYSPQVSTFMFNRNFLIDNNLKFNENIKYGEDRYFQMELMNLNTKFKYKHIFSFNYNLYLSNNSMMRAKKENCENNLICVDLALKSKFKNKRVFSLEMVVYDWFSVYKQGFYNDKKESLKIYKEYIKRINPNFDIWLKMDSAGKFLYLYYLICK
ncbi:MAG: glycosyltransferase family 2 protein [Mycoplasma sp.]|nr:glycosyltransferase family 2 protein [Mycoplasma sp.]